MSSNLLRFFKNNRLLTILTALAFILAWLFRQSPAACWTFVDWRTIRTLSGLLIVTYGIKESGFFNWLAYKLLHRLHNERTLALSLVLTSFILSMFLTNDIALFITIPLTLSFQHLLNNDYTKLIIFQAIAVNSGSSLTPIGNPQNIFLWHQWGIRFPEFVIQMLPLLAVVTPVLFIYVFFVFPSKSISIVSREKPPVQRFLFISSAIGLLSFVLAIEFKLSGYFLPFLLLFYILFFRRILFKADWSLILLFIVLFIDIRLLFYFKELFFWFGHLPLNQAPFLLLTAAGLSQFISNVPATIFLTQFSTNFKIIAFGVNIGGNGLLMASFANIIALNFVKKKNKYWRFHLYSIPFFVFTLILLWGLLKVVN